MLNLLSWATQYIKGWSSNTNNKVSGGGGMVAVDKFIPSYQILVPKNTLEGVFLVMSLGFKATRTTTSTL